MTPRGGFVSKNIYCVPYQCDRVVSPGHHSPRRCIPFRIYYCCYFHIYISIFRVANIRGHLAAAVPPSDQILLIGPPYKVPKDSTFQSDAVLNSLRLGDAEDDPILEEPTATGAATASSEQQPDQEQQQRQHQQRSRTILSTTERTGARRLFLFSKRALTQDAPDPAPCILEPTDVALPQEPPGPSPLSLQPNAAALAQSSPLHQALAAYERQFMLYLSQGRVLADAADMRLSACTGCVKEQAVMSRALRAAVSNMSDHYNNAARTRAEFTAEFQSKSAQHSNLLQGFESLLQSLANIQLHPALVNVARSSGRTMETLIDTVPVDRERSWVRQCQAGHQRLLALFGELDAAFTELGTPASREEEARLDREVEQEVENLWAEVDGTAKSVRDLQSSRLERLTSDHTKVVQIVVKAMNSGNDDEVQAAFTPLRELSDFSKNVIPKMVEDDNRLKQLMERVADAKTRGMKRSKVRLRNVSIAQSSIQRALSHVGVLRDALAQQSENMVHLEHVAELPASYREFLSEIRRRRAFGQAISSTSTAMMERLAVIRDDEVKNREKFLRGPGRHLMPAFYEIFAPTLALPPPLFTPQLPSTVEVDALPDVGPSDDSRSATPADAVMQGTSTANVGVVPGDHGVSSASSLTAESHPQTGHRAGASVEDGGVHEASMADAPGASDTENKNRQQDQQQQQEQDQLIVSASEQSGNDLILDDPAAGAAADAEAKALAYENAVLRQALERLGGKPPRTYVLEARARDTAAGKTDEAEIAALRKELLAAKADAKAAKEAFQAQQDTAKTAAVAAAAVAATTSPSSSGDDVDKDSNVLSDKISHSSFKVGDVGLFMPTGRGSGGKRTYLAFHTQCPYRFLNTDNIKGTPDFVLGRIVYQEELVAGELGTDANPYGLPVGTSFWVLTVEILTSQS